MTIDQEVVSLSLQEVRNLAIWTQIRSLDTGTVYVWTNRTRTRDGETALVFAATDTGRLIQLDATSPIRFTVLPEMCEGAMRLFVAELLRLDANIRETETEVVNLRGWRRQATHDWELLNDKLHGEARDRGWCETYDHCIDDWNSQFQVFELQPRTVTRSIEVTVNASWTFSVQIPDTRTDDDAEAAIQDDDFSELLRRGRESTGTPDDWSYETNSVEVV